MLQPANFSISRLSSTNGKPRSSASIWPSVDLPAPRRPISATRAGARRIALAPPVPSSSPTATRTRLQRGLVAVLQQFADQQPFGRGGGDVADQFGQRALQRTGHLQQHQDRRIADAVFQVGQVALGHVGRQRQRLAGHAAARAQARTRSPSATRNGFLLTWS
jgi:hypothetical protein